MSMHFTEAPTQSMPPVQVGFLMAHILKGDRCWLRGSGSLSCVRESSCLTLCALRPAHPEDVQRSVASGPCCIFTGRPCSIHHFSAAAQLKGTFLQLNAKIAVCLCQQVHQLMVWRLTSPA